MAEEQKVVKYDLDGFDVLTTALTCLLYTSLFGEKAIPEADFNRLVWDSCKKIDNATTGVDNVKKLKIEMCIRDRYEILRTASQVDVIKCLSDIWASIRERNEQINAR